MTDAEYERKLHEIDRLLNDPAAPLDPAKIWSLLAEIAHHESGAPMFADTTRVISDARTGT